MDPEGSVCNPLDLKGMLNDKKAKPRYLRISLLESITNNFSDDLVLGSGGFSIVYKGLLQNGVVAVKKLTQMLDVHEERFREEVDCLMRVKHKNIVRFLGYCSDTQGKFWELNGKTVIAEERQRFLCFEYLPGSLDKYMKEQPRGHEWTTCYQIIKGICEGLHYLHDQKIVHLDLKPANILLDHDMVPKIADFGLSKRFDKDQTHAITSNLIGSQGYMAPEFFGGLITFKSDIYSLGIIIIEILSGNKGYPDIDNVLESWRIKFETSPGDAQLEPVRVCTEIAIECTDFNPAKRPDTWRILESLHEMESTYGVFEMADKAPYSVQGITSVVPMGPGSTSTEHNIVAANAGGGPSRGLFQQKLSRTTTWKQSMPWTFEYPAKASVQTIMDPAKEFRFSFKQLHAATMGFSLETKIGEGAYGSVYRGVFPDGREVAIKVGHSHLDSLAEKVFRLEVAILFRLNHKHLVSFVGYCIENKERLIVLDYMKNGSLYDHLHPEKKTPPLPLSPVASLWKLRIKILLDASRGIEYLHMYTVPPVIHRDIKSSNIFLDADLTARVSDFGMSLLSRDAEDDFREVVAGKFGYIDPEYLKSGERTVKRDVYGFGVVMLEVLTGKCAITDKGGHPITLVRHAVPSIVAGELGKVLDARMPDPVGHEAEALKEVACSAVHCVRLESTELPTMSDVVSKLETAYTLVGGLVNSSSSASLSLRSLGSWEAFV